MIVRRKTITPVGIFLINDYALPAFCGHSISAETNGDTVGNNQDWTPA